LSTDHNLREQYADWQALVAACQQFMADVNTRPHRATGQPPVALLAEEREFLAIGHGAERWLTRAAAEGTQRIRRKMAEAVDLAELHGAQQVNEAFERCASYGRFGMGTWPASWPTNSKRA
jgi:hypothetical protein